MNKKTILITGITSGIGFATSKQLANQGWFIIGTYRDESKKENVLTALKENCILIKADLSKKADLEQVAEETKRIVGNNGLNGLINNAGTFFSKFKLSEDGIEMQFSVNTIAPFYLSLLLYKTIEKANGKIINLSSSSHYRTKINWNDIQLEKNYGQLKAYKQSKVLSVLLARQFNKLSKNIKIYMADPGLVNTEMGFKNTGKLARIIWKYRKERGQTPDQGAQTSVYLATHAKLDNHLYWKNCTPKKPSQNALNDNYALRIWDYCSTIIDITPKEYMEPDA